jgi:uncharacterized protein
MDERFYGSWHFARHALARRYLRQLIQGPGDPLVLVNVRRIGKTTFLLKDLAPAALEAGMLPVYIDLWQNRADPLAAINYALQEAIDDLDRVSGPRREVRPIRGREGSRALQALSLRR